MLVLEMYRWKYLPFNRFYPLKVNKEKFPDSLRIYIMLSFDSLKTFVNKYFQILVEKRTFAPFSRTFIFLENVANIETWKKLWVYPEIGTTSVHKNNGTNHKFYLKVAFLMYTEMFNFRPQSWKAASKPKPHWGLGTRLSSLWKWSRDSLELRS